MNISLRTVATSLGLLSFLALASACGDHPGGSVGDACTDIGTPGEDAGCAEDEICDSVSGFGDDAYCLRECTDQADCEENEDCNGISGSSGKACHPKSGDDDGETAEGDSETKPK